MREEEIKAARLLSKNEDLSAFDKDAMLEGLLRAEDPARARAGLRWLWAGIPTLLAAAAALFLVVKPVDRGQEFSSRSGPLGAGLEVLCDPGPRCEVGSELTLRVMHAPTDAEYVAAFAVREDGAVIWYIPHDTAAQSSRFAEEQWLEQGVHLGEEHAPGQYTLRAFLSSQPLSMDDVKQFAETGQGETITELKTTFTVHEPMEQAP